MLATNGYAAFSPKQKLAPWQFTRRDPGPRDVHIAISHCGICHSDLHTVRGEWGDIAYPQVPGHEIVGRVVSVGTEVTRFSPGDRVGVGCLVDSCRGCGACTEGLEQYCERGATWTYGSVEKETGQATQGGYADRIVVDERFVLRIPDGMDAAGAAPLLCAGITTYSPLRTWRAGPGTRVGVVGLGGLGHIAVRIARAMGAHVVALTTSPAKADDARRLGAHDVIVTSTRSRDRVLPGDHRETLDLLIDTVGTPHDLGPELLLLRRDGTLVLLGGSPEPHPAIPVNAFINRRRRLAGSLIGGIAETQEMLDFCAAHGITADVECIAARDVNVAYERMLRGDVRYRFVIDCATLAG